MSNWMKSIQRTQDQNCTHSNGQPAETNSETRRSQLIRFSTLTSSFHSLGALLSERLEYPRKLIDDDKRDKIILG